MFDTLYSQIGAAVAVVVVAFALLRGDQPERFGGVAYMLGMLASLLVQDEVRLQGPQWSMMAVDIVMLAVYAALAWKSRRSWPAWAAALQAVVVASHLLTLTDFRPPILAFYAVINLAAYGILLALTLGVIGAWRAASAPASSPSAAS